MRKATPYDPPALLAFDEDEVDVNRIGIFDDEAHTMTSRIQRDRTAVERGNELRSVQYHTHGHESRLALIFERERDARQSRVDLS